MTTGVPRCHWDSNGGPPLLSGRGGAGASARRWRTNRPPRGGRAGLAQLGLEGLERRELGVRQIQAAIEPPGLPGRPVRLLQRAALAGPDRRRPEQSGFDELAYVVQHGARILAEPVGQLLIRQLMLAAQPQDALPERMAERFDLAHRGRAALVRRHWCGGWF